LRWLDGLYSCNGLPKCLADGLTLGSVQRLSGRRLSIMSRVGTLGSTFTHRGLDKVQTLSSRRLGMVSRVGTLDSGPGGTFRGVLGRCRMEPRFHIPGFSFLGSGLLLSGLLGKITGRKLTGIASRKIVDLRKKR
jgi:hypothetical protein